MSKRKQGRSSPPSTRSQPASAAPAIAARPATVSSVPFRTALLFAPVILGGAFLLFAVQPLIARFVLPWFGGGPGVWTTCMLFFQALLLGGYLYAHLSVRYLPTRAQVALHVILVAGALAMIPIIPSTQWKPSGVDDPVWRILLLLAATIGLPYFVLSATSPLLQAWFAKVTPGVSPYRLFALSNLGSLIALLGYPTILEPLFTRRQQAWIWSVGLIVFVVACIACALHVWRRAPRTSLPSDSTEETSRVKQPAGILAIWLALPLVASILLLATTNTLTEDVAVFPLLWIIPLALYLLTFVIAFDSPRWYPRRVVLILLTLCTLWILRLQWLKTDTTLLEQFLGYPIAMFVLCLFCHGELARLKPDSSRLTTYYLMISVGGAFGGVFVAIVAPRVFDRLVELPIGVLAAALLAIFCLRRDPLLDGRRWALVFTGAATLLVASLVLKPMFDRRGGERVIDRSRNFYGTLVTAEIDAGGQGNPVDAARVMNHGTTSHGQQYLAPERRKETTLYYRIGSGVSYAMHFFPRTENRKFGLVGLGAGTLAAYGKAGDTFRFYEINPDVERMAREHFTFLSDSPAASSVVLGDARLTLEREEQPQAFDILILDAFTGDAIPTHLLTAEAFDIYRRHLKDDGVIAVHISNRSVDLIQVVLRQTERLGLQYSIVNDHDQTTGRLVSRWMLLTNNETFLKTPAVFQATRVVDPNPAIKLWTDDQINLMQVIKWVPRTASGAK